MKIKLGNRELPITAASIMRSMNGSASEWSCTIPEVKRSVDPELYNLIKPRSFADAVAYIGDQRLCTGNKYITSVNVQSSGSGVTLRGFSKTFRLAKSQPKEQREFLQSSLDEISNAFAKPFGLLVKYDNAIQSQMQEKFSDEKIGAKDTIYSFLQNLARQRSLLMSDDEFGNIKYLQASSNAQTVGSIIEGETAQTPLSETFSLTVDDTQISQTYYTVNNSSLAYLLNFPTGVSKNSSIKIPSFRVIDVSSLIEGAGQKAADFTRNYDLAASISLPLEVKGWIAPNGELWRENTRVSVVGESLFIPDGFTFLITQVQYNLDSDGGERTILSVLPPSLYTGGAIEEPWA